MPQHILLYTDAPETGGVAQYNHTILSGLINRGYQVTCVQSKNDSPLIQQQQALGIRHEWLSFDPVKEFDRNLTDIQTAAALLKRICPDLIFFSDCCPLSNFAAKQAVLHYGAPYSMVVGFVASYLAERFSSYLPALSDQFAQAQAVIAVSQENLDLLHEQFRLPPDQGQVIYPGRPESYFAPRNQAEHDRLRKELNIPADAVVCFTAARLEGIKGFDYQLQAIAQLQHTPIWQNLYWIWAGEGSLKAQLADIIQQLGASNQVKLLGQRWDVSSWYDAADLFVLPTRLEGMPLAVMEAMAKGLPVVASAVSGIPEELGNTGKLLPNPELDPQETVRELVATIQAWAKNSELRDAVGQACKQRAEQMFTEARMVQETLDLVERGLPVDQGGRSVEITLPAAMQKVMELRPLVSVVIPCYKQAHFLPEAIASVVVQTYENWEIIVVNDGSPDNTSAVTQQMIAIYSKYTIKLIEKENGGLPSITRNTGIASANGEYILPLDADDKLHSEALMNLLMLSVEAGIPCVAFGSYRTFSDAHETAPETMISADHYSIDRIKQFNMLQVASLYPKSVWQMVKGYNEDKGIGYEDWEFWLNCHAHQIPFVGTREVVVYYRRVKGSTASKDYQKHDQLYAQIVCYHPALFGSDAVRAAENLLQAFERLNPIEIFSTQQLEKLAQYQQLFADPIYLDQLQQARQQIAEHWLSLAIDQLEEMYTSTLGQLHQILLNSSLKSQPLTHSEQAFVDEISTGLSEQSDQSQTAAYLLAAMLYLHPHQLPQIDLTLLPHWLLNGYLEFVFAYPGSESASEQALELTLSQQTAAIRHSLKLRQINLIAFPDWSQPEELLFSDLVELLRGVVTHVDRDRITLLIDTSNGDEAEADLVISSVIMHLLVEEELDLAETGPEISLIGQLKKAQWRVLLSQISARLQLETENQRAIASTGANNLPLQQMQCRQM